MNFYKTHSRKKTKQIGKIIATIEKSAGNDSIGDMWTETKSFDIETPASEIIAWAEQNNCSGKLVITIDESSVEYFDND